MLDVAPHATSAHLVRRPETRVRRMQTLLLDEGQPSLERRVVDARVFGALGKGPSFEDGHAVGDGVDGGSAGDVVDLGQRQHAFEDVLLVERAGRVGDAAPSVGGVGVDAAGVAVAREGDVSRHMFELGAEEFEVETAEPGLECEPPAGQHDHVLELGAVAVAVEVFEFAADRRQDSAFPWSDFGVVGRSDEVHCVQNMLEARIVAKSKRGLTWV